MRLCVLSLVVVLAACGSSPPATPDAAADAAPDAAVDAAVDAVPSDALGTCQVVADLGGVVMEMDVATATPTPAGGGPIPDGTYVLTALTRYTGTGGATGPTGTVQSATSYLAGGLSHHVTTSGGTPVYDSYSIEPNGTAVVIVHTCPGSPTPTSLDGYSSSGGVVTFYDSQNAGSREYTKLP